ncbi:MAG: ABC transporter permease [Eubacteriales bacterium]
MNILDTTPDYEKMTRKEILKTFKKRSRMYEISKSYCRNKLAVVGLVIFTILVGLAVCAPLYLDYESMCISIDPVNRLLPIGTPGHLLGTDEMGRDVWARLIYGARISLKIGFLGVIFGLIIGGAMGAIAGYFGGIIDDIVMRIMDVFNCLPSVLLAIAIVAAFGTSEFNMLIAIGVGRIPAFARVVRSSVLSVSGMEYVEAARAIGATDTTIILKHVLVNSLAPIIVQTTLGVAGCISSISALSFIGLGIQAPTPEWGNMLAYGRAYMRDHMNMVLAPGFAIFFTILSLNLIGDGLRDALDPRLKQ